MEDADGEKTPEKSSRWQSSSSNKRFNLSKSLASAHPPSQLRCCSFRSKGYRSFRHSKGQLQSRPICMIQPCTMRRRTSSVLSCSIWTLGLLVAVDHVAALSSTLPTSRITARAGRSTMSRSATNSYTYYTVVDGPSWESLRDSPLVQAKDGQTPSSSIGTLPVVAGTLESTQEKVIGLLASDDDDKEKDNRNETLALTTGEMVWKESVARLQGGVKQEDAAATYAMSLTHLYPLTASQLPSVGGSEETFSSVSVPKDNAVVILGGNPEAVWAAQALTTLGSTVTLVSPNKPSLPKSVTVLTPNDDDAFVETVGKIEALLDTVGREGPLSRPVQLLASRHGCQIYRSTRTKAEEIVASEGLLFGPGKAKDYLKSLPGKAKNAPSSTLSVTGLGALVEQLLKAKVVAPSLETINQAQSSTTWVRGWSLKNTWEANTWPSNTDGSRFGFPTLEDDEEEDEEDDDYVVVDDENRSEADVLQSGKRSQAQPSSTSPFIKSVYGPEGLEEDIIKPEQDCILFMSAPFCRTCRKLQAPYARLARLNHEDDNSKVLFAKADIVGSFGKALGKSLGVNAVPTFVLFRKGERFGKPLVISKLPDQQFDLALAFLKDKQDWDDSQFDSGTKNRPQTKI